jgi:hypothetical protein
LSITLDGIVFEEHLEHKDSIIIPSGMKALYDNVRDIQSSSIKNWNLARL